MKSVAGCRLSVVSRSLFVGFLVFAIAGCAPTYPKEKFKESIIRLCKNEYKVDIKVETVGKTIVIYAPLPDLIDFTFAISKAASEKINDIILSVSRVALSTDAKFDFYCVIAQDMRMPEIQIVIIKSVDDVKRFLLNDISRGEYSKRMLVDIRMNPQSQKEKAIKDVFDKMAIDKKWQEQVMNDFFRATPVVLGDIGYWNNRFYIKDITLPEFLAEQITSRVRLEYREDKFVADLLSIKSAKGYYDSKDGIRYFRIEVLAEPKWIKQFEPSEIPNSIFKLSLNIASQVLHGYHFEDYDHIEIIEQQSGRVLTVSRIDLEKFRTKKLKFEEILK